MDANAVIRNPFVKNVGKKYYAILSPIAGVRGADVIRIPRWWMEGHNPPKDRGKRRTSKGRFGTPKRGGKNA